MDPKDSLSFDKAAAEFIFRLRFPEPADDILRGIIDLDDIFMVGCIRTLDDENA